jgi:TnpA family transposase
MRTLLWSYLGWHRFPRELSLFEVRQFFSLARSDRQALRRRFRSRARLGAALQLGFVRMAGTTLEAFDHLPREVLAHVARQLSLAAPELATLRALYRRRSTLFAHQSWACAYTGLHWPEAATRP